MLSLPVQMCFTAMISRADCKLWPSSLAGAKGVKGRASTDDGPALAGASAHQLVQGCLKVLLQLPVSVVGRDWLRTGECNANFAVHGLQLHCGVSYREGGCMLLACWPAANSHGWDVRDARVSVCVTTPVQQPAEFEYA